MNRNDSKILSVGSRLLGLAIILFLSVFAFWIIISNRSPNLLRPLSMLLRTGYTVVLPLIYLALYLAFRLKGWLGNLLSLLLTLSIFALALAGAWASGQTESGILSGVIPMFDSTDYYTDALRLLASQEFSELSTRRPFFIAFFAFLLRITDHNLLYALALLTLFVALACYLLTREINETHGPVVAIFALVFIFFYYRFHSGAIRTENLGVLFGVLGTAFIWQGITSSGPFYLITGIFLTSIGMIARAGAFFVLPLLVLWGAFLFRPTEKLISWKFLVGGMLTITSAFLINQVFVKAFGASEAMPFGNFSYSLYGLAAGGKSWAYVLEVYPEAGYLEIYKMAFQLIVEQPNLLIQGVAYNLAMFFSNTSYGLFSYIGGEGELSTTISYAGLLILSFLGIWNWFHNRKDPYLGFIMVSTVGLLFSVPFLPPTDAFRLRAYATSIPILALVPSMGLDWVLVTLKLGKLNPKRTNLTSKYLLAAFSAFVVVALILGPFASRGIDSPPVAASLKCEADSIPVLVQYEPSAAVHFVSQNVPLLDWVPIFHIGTLHSNIHDFPNFGFIDWVSGQVSPNETLFYSLDYSSYRQVLILISSALVPDHTAWLGLCGTMEENSDLARFNIYYALSAHDVGD